MKTILTALLALGVLTSANAYSLQSVCDTTVNVVPAEQPDATTDKSPAHIVLITSAERLVKSKTSARASFSCRKRCRINEDAESYRQTPTFVFIGNNLWALIIVPRATELGLWFIGGASTLIGPISQTTTIDACVATNFIFE